MIAYPNPRKYKMRFLPEGYKSPKSGGDYMKVQVGENRIRILTPPIYGWEDWTLDSPPKPLRFTLDNKPARSINPNKKVQYFWAMVIWNYNEEQIQLWSFTQATIRNPIESFSNDESWGSPFGYDLKIIKTGSGKNSTEYTVNPMPHREISPEIKELFNEHPIHLEALYEGLDPFSDVNHLNRAKPFWEMEVTVPSQHKTVTVNEPKEAYFTIDPAMAKALEQQIQDKIAPNDPEYLQRLLRNFGKTSIDKIELGHQKNIAQNIQLKISQIQEAAKATEFDEVPF